MAGKLDNLIVVGDKVLIKPRTASKQTKSGLFLPPGYTEKEDIQSGFVVKTGPGYPIPFPGDDDSEPWKQHGDSVKYIPLQVKVGDMAIYLQKSAVEIQFHNEKFYLVPQHAILLIERDNDI